MKCDHTIGTHLRLCFEEYNTFSSNSEIEENVHVSDKTIPDTEYNFCPECGAKLTFVGKEWKNPVDTVLRELLEKQEFEEVVRDKYYVRAELALRTYSCEGLTGHYIGGSAVVLAHSKEEAKELILQASQEEGLTQDEGFEDDMNSSPAYGRGGVIVFDKGDY